MSIRKVTVQCLTRENGNRQGTHLLRPRLRVFLDGAKRLFKVSVLPSDDMETYWLQV